MMILHLLYYVKNFIVTKTAAAGPAFHPDRVRSLPQPAGKNQAVFQGPGFFPESGLRLLSVGAAKVMQSPEIPVCRGG
jgi:hypothetical protein